MSLGLSMEEIQELIEQASENTPDVGPDGHEMGDPEYVTAYLLNILIPLIRFNNLRIEEQLAAHWHHRANERANPGSARRAKGKAGANRSRQHGCAVERERSPDKPVE